jgi:hypothetical protein
MYLSIASLDPFLVKAVAPESALAAIGRVILAAVRAPRRMGTRRIRRRGWNGRVRLGVPFATPAERTMMLSVVRSRADGASDLGGVALRQGVTPSPAPLAEGGTRVGPGGVEWTYEPSDLN